MRGESNTVSAFRRISTKNEHGSPRGRVLAAAAIAAVASA
jgi:hypothetical protein